LPETSVDEASSEPVHTLLRSAFKNSRNLLLQFTGIATVNKETYINILRRLRDAVRRKRPEKWRTSSSVLFYDNGPAHRSVLVKDFLAKNNVTRLQPPPYPPDPAPADFCVFPPLKSALNGWRFCYATEIKNATEELKRLSQNGFFQECFQHL
jgi:transposase